MKNYPKAEFVGNFKPLEPKNNWVENIRKDLKMKNILGIDPGINGAVALVVNDHDDKPICIHDIDGNITQVCLQLREWNEAYRIDGVIIEKVSAMPQQGVSSVFSFGEITGQLKGICLGLGIPILAEPRPADWKKKVGIVLNPPTKPKQKDFGTNTYEWGRALVKHKSEASAYKREQKNVSRNRAAELYPSIAGELSRVKDSDRAEAVLLAHYGVML